MRLKALISIAQFRRVLATVFARNCLVNVLAKFENLFLLRLITALESFFEPQLLFHSAVE
jgi:hypothetical protein